MRFYGICFICFMGSIALFIPEALAQGAVNPELLPPQWMLDTYAWVSNIPYVGVVVVYFFKFAGFLAALLTVISATLMGLAKSVAILSYWAGLEELSKKVNDWANKILPALQYLSMFNVQKRNKI